MRRGETFQTLAGQQPAIPGFQLITVNGQTYDLYDVLSLNRVSGILIIKDGEILFEKYLLGNDEHTRWMSMSVVKSMTATLIGAAIQDGYIAASTIRSSITCRASRTQPTTA